MKKCYKCKVEKPLESFSLNAVRKDGLSSHCKDCHKVMRRHHYERNKTKILSQVQRKKDQYCEWLMSLKNDVPCTDCGKKYPHYVMDYDHLGDKEFSISSARRGRWSKERVLAEIEKCELVCANCHRERTFQRLYAPVA